MLNYSQATLETVRDELGISVLQGIILPVSLAASYLPAWLTAFLAASTVSVAVYRSEKSVSEALVAPVLQAVREANVSCISVFSGEPLTYNDSDEVCDFIITARPNAFVPDAPIIIVRTASKLNLFGSIPQCLTEMRTAQRLNEQAGRSGPVYGCVTIGTEWLFLKL